MRVRKCYVLLPKNDDDEAFRVVLFRSSEPHCKHCMALSVKEKRMNVYGCCCAHASQYLKSHPPTN